MSILIVDDSQIMRAVLKDIIVGNTQIPPEDIEEADGGTEAIKKYKANKPDLVFLDIIMPDIEGTDVVKELIKIDPAAKIVMCSYSSDAEDAQVCFEAGAKGYIFKPPKPDEVKAAISAVLGK